MVDSDLSESSAENEEHTDKNLSDSIPNPNENSVHEGNEQKSPHFKYSKEANNNHENEHETQQNTHKRSRRAARQKEDNRNTCSLYIQTDPLIWRHIREGIADVSLFKVFLLYS